MIKRREMLTSAPGVLVKDFKQ